MIEGPAIATTRGAVRAMLKAFAGIGLDADAIHAVARPRLEGPPIAGAEGAPPHLSELYILWEAARAATGESGLGVRLAESGNPRGVTLFGELAQSASTLGEALVLEIRSMRLVAASMQVSLHIGPERATVSFARLYRSVPHEDSVEFAMASLVRLARKLTGVDLPILEATFEHDKPRDTTHQQRMFGTTLRYGAAQSAYYFDSAQLLLPIATADFARRRELEQRAARALAVNDNSAGFQRAVRAAIERELQHGDASHVRVAAGLDLHPKAFARKLAAHSLAFRDLLDAARYELADRHLRQPDARVAQVALMLGYSEKSAFNRAFKRWAGLSPQNFRRSLGLTPAGADDDP